MEFDGRVALVTGAAGSIGRAIAARLVAEGAEVFVTDIDQGRLAQVAAQLGPRCRALPADVRDAQQVAAVVREACQAFGDRIDVLVNVAGIVGRGGPVEQLTAETWDDVFAVNCRGTFLFCREVVPLMKRAGKGASSTSRASRARRARRC